MIVKTFGSNYSQVQSCDVVSVCLRSLNDDLNLYIKAFTRPTICSPIANQAVDVAARSYSHLSDLPLADSCVAKSHADVDMLIGADYFWSIVTGIVRRGEEGPLATETKLGWVLSGIVSENCYDSVSSVNAATHCMEVLSVSEEEQQNSKLEDQLRKFWEPESIGISVKEPTAYERFVDTIKNTGGRYEVELPWKESHALLPENYVLSVGRLKHLMHRLRKDPVLLKEYDQIVREQERLCIVETVDSRQPTKVGKVHYLPHHPVIRRDKLTTKVRTVFDGPSRAKGPSLNSCLLAGPSLTPKIMDVLIRFRWYQVALVADIEKAFLMVSVAVHERDCSRFSWFEDILADNLKMVIKRFTRAVFGVISSPFLLNETLKSHIESYLYQDPEFVNKILASWYVDDLNSGASTVDQAFDLYTESKSRMKDAGFNHRKWISNSKQLMSQIEAQERASMSDQMVDYSMHYISSDDQTFAKYTVGTGQTKLSGQVDEQKTSG